jgi:hypothetical protein
MGALSYIDRRLYFEYYWTFLKDGLVKSQAANFGRIWLPKMSGRNALVSRALAQAAA